MSDKPKDYEVSADGRWWQYNGTAALPEGTKWVREINRPETARPVGSDPTAGDQRTPEMRAQDACPYWTDGVHLYVQFDEYPTKGGVISAPSGSSARFPGVTDFPVVAAKKRCACAAEVKAR